MARFQLYGSPFSDFSHSFGFDEPEYAKNYQRPTLLISWVRWHGPYNSFEEWTNAAEKFEGNKRVRLYLALGKKRWYSIFAQPQVQYVGLNSRDAELKLHKEIEDKKRTKSKTFGAAFNEFWVGELITDWEKVARKCSETEECDVTVEEIDTPTKGLSKNTEHSLIFALQPEQDDRDKYVRPKFSFRVINQICADKKHKQRIVKRFQNLIPDYIEYNRAEYEQNDEIKKCRLIFRSW